MRPEEYALIVFRRWWLPLLAMLAAAAVAFGYTSTQPTTYQAASNVMAIAQPPDYWLDLYAKNRLASYRDLMNNWSFVADALAAANVDVDVNYAIPRLQVGHNPDSNTVYVLFTDTNAERTAQVSNAVTDAFVARAAIDNQRILNSYRTSEGEPRGTIEIVKLVTASTPNTPIGPRVKLNTAAAAMLGLVFGVLLTFVVEYLDDTLRTDRDVDRYLDLPTIAGIPAVRAEEAR